MESLLTIEFTAYVALAVILYAIREATGLSNKFIPGVAVILGVAFAVFESGVFSFDVLITGLQYALFGVGSVATIKYAHRKRN
ncbi:hypothetical protein ACSVDA_20870 [Cytobacillus sp. Hm23]